jgi:hypothetical protein
MDHQRFLNNLLSQAEEQPIMALGAAAALITAISKFVEASGRRKSTLAYAKREEARLKAQKKHTK